MALSNANGGIVEQYSYDVFGEPNRVSAVWNPYFFTGREHDAETGLYYYRARYYSPKIGRFLQTDPIGYADGLNLYTYCGNDPINWVDPWGEAEIRTAPVVWPIGPLARWAYGPTIYSHHWQIFYYSGSNSGYFGGRYGFWGSPVFGPDGIRTIQDYGRVRWTNLNDLLLQQAERIVQERWRKEKRKFDLLNNNCQSYVLEVLREYKKLEKKEKEKDS